MTTMERRNSFNMNGIDDNNSDIKYKLDTATAAANDDGMNGDNGDEKMIRVVKDCDDDNNNDDYDSVDDDACRTAAAAMPMLAPALGSMTPKQNNTERKSFTSGMSNSYHLNGSNATNTSISGSKTNKKRNSFSSWTSNSSHDASNAAATSVNPIDNSSNHSSPSRSDTIGTSNTSSTNVRNNSTKITEDGAFCSWHGFDDGSNTSPGGNNNNNRNIRSHSRSFSATSSTSSKSRSSSIRALLGSNSLTDTARATLVELSELRLSDVQIQGRQEEIQLIQQAYDRVASANATGSRNGNNSIPSLPNQQQQQQQPELILISGVSGSGKTFLAKSALTCSSSSNAIRSSGRRSVHQFHGKFDIQQTGEPYTAILSAFDELFASLLLEEDEQQEEIRNDLKTAANTASTKTTTVTSMNPTTQQPDKRILLRRQLLQELYGTTKPGTFLSAYNEVVMMIPSLYKFLMQGLTSPSHKDKDAEAESILFTMASTAPSTNAPTMTGDAPTQVDAAIESFGTAEAKFRLKFLFLALTRAVSAYFDPLVFVLDDIQWADLPSLKVLEQMLTDTTNPHLLIIATMRNDDPKVQDPTSHISTFLHQIGRSRSTSQTNTVQSLRYQDSCSSNERETSSVQSALSSTGSARRVEPFGNATDRKVTIRCKDIELGYLSVESVNELVSSVLRSEPELTISLSHVVHRKTHGNPFFVLEFIRTLHSTGVLDYNIACVRWVWDQTKVEECYVADNVASILKVKMKQLDRTTYFVAQVAACIGASFQAPVLFIACQAIKNSLYASNKVANGLNLEKSVDNDLIITTGSFFHSTERLMIEGLLERGRNESELFFSHDHIQQAALDSIPSELYSHWQVAIGEGMLSQIPPEEIEESYLFLVCDLCNSGASALITELDDPLKRSELVQLNYRAGKRSMAVSSFTNGCEYFETAIALLGDKKWEDECVSLTLDIYANAVECHFCTANYEKMQIYIDEALSQDNIAFEAKLRIKIGSINGLVARAMWPETINDGLKTLNMIGIGTKFPTKNPSTARIVFELLKARAAVNKRSFEELSNLPLLSDHRRIFAERLIDILVTATYVYRPEYFPILPLLHVQLCIQHGVSSYSPVAFATLGIIVGSKLGKLREAYDLGRVALALIRRVPSRAAESRIYFLVYGLLFVWQDPIASMVRHSERGYKIGMQLGDVESATYGQMMMVALSFYSGRPLATVAKLALEAVAIADHYGIYNSKSFIVPYGGFAHKLMGIDDSPLILYHTATDSLQENEFRSESEICFIYARQLEVSYYMEEAVEMEDLLYKSRRLPEQGPSTTHAMRYPFQEGLVSSYLFGHYKAKGKNSIARKWAKKLGKAHRQLRKWAKAGNVNVVHMVCLLEAESMVMKGQRQQATALYERAIALASRHGFLQDKSTAHERAGINFHHLLDPYWSNYHLKAAYESYQAWGATIKCQQLVDKYPDLLQVALDRSCEVPILE